MKTIDEIIKEFEQLINPNNNAVENLVRDAMPAIIEGFIEFYGEESREEITEKFNNTKIAFVPYDFNEAFNYMLIKPIKKYLETKYSINFRDWSITISKDGIKLMSFYGETMSPELTSELDQINKKIETFLNSYERYRIISESFKETYNEEAKKELNNFIRKILMEELAYTEEMVNLNEFDLETNTPLSLFRQFEENGKFYNPNKVFDIYGLVVSLRSLGINIPPLYFENETGNFSLEEFKNVKEEFMRVINSEEISKYIPTPKIAKKICDEYQKIFRKGQVTLNAVLMSKFYGIAPKLFPNSFTEEDYLSTLQIGYHGEATPILIHSKNNDKVDIRFLIALANNIADIKSLGNLIIHELNHGIEMDIISDSENYYFRSGWDIARARNKNGYDSRGDYSTGRPFELLNECLNDLITKDIRENVRKRTNNIIFSYIEENLYSNAFFVVEEFYQLYKPEIIESRKNHNMAALYQKIGHENFEALAELMRIVSSKLYAGEFDYKRAMKNLESGIANEETEFLVYVIQQRDQILGNMKEYSQSSHMSRGNITINSIILLLMYAFILLYIIITILI